jgi:hypothetical protein
LPNKAKTCYSTFFYTFLHLFTQLNTPPVSQKPDERDGCVRPAVPDGRLAGSRSCLASSADAFSLCLLRRPLQLHLPPAPPAGGSRRPEGPGGSTDYRLHLPSSSSSVSNGLGDERRACTYCRIDRFCRETDFTVRLRTPLH